MTNALRQARLRQRGRVLPIITDQKAISALDAIKPLTGGRSYRLIIERALLAYYTGLLAEGAKLAKRQRLQGAGVD